MKANKSTFFIVAFVTAALLYLAFYGLHIGSLNIKGANEMRYGIDIRGGVSAKYTPKDLGRAPTADELNAAKSVIETRMDALNITDRDVAIDTESGAVFVKFP